MKPPKIAGKNYIKDNQMFSFVSKERFGDAGGSRGARYSQ